MKKSIIAIAFLLLCPFYGVRAQERPFFDLSGKGWHLWQDKNAAWQTEDIYLTLEEARKSPVIVPTAGWDILTSAQALPVQVPGTAEAAGKRRCILRHRAWNVRDRRLAYFK